MNQIIDLSGQPAVEGNASAAGLINAEIDMQIATAHRFPRSVDRFRKTALAHATLTEEIAQQCLFALPRGGKIIEGPSVRFAEILVASWGNCRVGARVVREERDFIVTQGVFHDLESNAAITIEVQRRITDRDGKRFNADMIVTTGNAARSIAMRNAVTQGIPKALWNDIYLAAKKASIGDLRTLAAKRDGAIKAFAPFGVTEAQIVAALGVSGRADIGSDQLAALLGWITAIKDEGVDPEEIFPSAQSLRAQSTKQAAAAAPKAPAAPKQEAAKAAAKAEAKDPARAAAPEPDPEYSTAAMLADAQAKGVPAQTTGAHLSHPLLDQITQNLLDARTHSAIDDVLAFLIGSIEAAPSDVKDAALALFDEARAALDAKEVQPDVDEFPGDAPAPAEAAPRKSFYERTLARIDGCKTPTELAQADVMARQNPDWRKLTDDERQDIIDRNATRLAQMTSEAA